MLASMMRVGDRRAVGIPKRSPALCMCMHSGVIKWKTGLVPGEVDGRWWVELEGEL